MESWVTVAPESDFPIQNLPYGVFSTDTDSTHRIGVAIGDWVLDLNELANSGFFNGPALSGSDCFAQPTLNAFMGLGQTAWKEARATLQRLLSAKEGALRDSPSRERCLLPMSSVSMHLPASIGDYTDFYASREHATNVGIMFRGKDNALQPNWLHLPVGYHGRASSVVVSGTDVHRPWGQLPGAPGAAPSWGPSKVVDYELEMGVFVGPGNALGAPLSVEAASKAIFGYVLMNDWSSRDVQRWEYVPLGPFTSKNWATTISPWVVTAEALAPFAHAPPQQDPEVLPYLRHAKGSTNYDVKLEVAVLPEGEDKETVLTRSSMGALYWTPAQMLAHHTVTGCNMRPGDLLATGTISNEGDKGAGCLLEATWNGRDPIPLESGGQRTFIQDGDLITMRGHCQGDGFRVGFGSAAGRLLAAKNFA
ncbi:fumarylacetoacetate hydrolase [Helicosporidium sp. ATCC 50920]|nr:fumarylacetoacetate hydrolase [Helicosporidium sp. ATCC 50920]|eukprot:KDD73772.1 fumarylacetoacetate hydrolase [Helicosporidium sp. ATCC 50920]